MSIQSNKKGKSKKKSKKGNHSAALRVFDDDSLPSNIGDFSGLFLDPYDDRIVKTKRKSKCSNVADNDFSTMKKATSLKKNVPCRAQVSDDFVEADSFSITDRDHSINRSGDSLRNENGGHKLMNAVLRSLEYAADKSEDHHKDTWLKIKLLSDKMLNASLA